MAASVGIHSAQVVITWGSKNEPLQVLTMDVGGHHISRDESLGNCPFNDYAFVKVDGVRDH